MANTLMEEMIVNRGTTILTQTLESVASSSVKLLKGNEIGIILDKKQMHTALKHNKKINARKLYFSYISFGNFLFFQKCLTQGRCIMVCYSQLNHCKYVAQICIL